MSISERKGPFSAIVINIPSERLRAKNNHSEDIHSARPHGHKISTSTSDRYEPSGTVAWHPGMCPGSQVVPLKGGECCRPCKWHHHPCQRLSGCRRGPGGVQGKRGEGRRDAGVQEGCSGRSGAGGLLALNGDVAAAAALTVLLVGGDLGCLDDQQPLR